MRMNDGSKKICLPFVDYLNFDLYFQFPESCCFFFFFLQHMNLNKKNFIQNMGILHNKCHGIDLTITTFYHPNISLTNFKIHVQTCFHQQRKWTFNTTTADCEIRTLDEFAAV